MTGCAFCSDDRVVAVIRDVAGNMQPTCGRHEPGSSPGEVSHAHQIDDIDAPMVKLVDGVEIALRPAVSSHTVCTSTRDVPEAEQYCRRKSVYDVLVDGEWKYDCLCQFHVLGWKPSELWEHSQRPRRRSA